MDGKCDTGKGNMYRERDETMCKTTKRDEREGNRQRHDMQMKEGKEKGKCKTKFIQEKGKGSQLTMRILGKGSLPNFASNAQRI